MRRGFQIVFCGRSKIQRSFNIQNPRRIAVWILVFDVSLVRGVWSLELFKNPALPYVLPVNKDQVAEILSEIAMLLELKGENPFKSRAYSNAARSVQGLNIPLEKAFAEDAEPVKGVGDSLREKIVEMI